MNRTQSRLILIGLLLLFATGAIVVNNQTLFFAKKVVQPSLFDDIKPIERTIEPKCPSGAQRQLINDNLDSYWRLTNRGADATTQANRLIAIARTLGYPDPTLEKMPDISKFLRQALKCPPS